MIALGALIAADVVGRELLGAPVPDTVTIVRELMVAAIVLPLAAATAARSHVAVEFLTDRLPVRWVSWLTAIGALVGALALTPLLFAGGRELAHNWTTGGFFYGDLNLPRWPGRALFLLGMGACFARLLVLAVRDARAAGRGEPVGRPAHPRGEVDG